MYKDSLAWAAGLFEGEGCFTSATTKLKNGKQSLQIRAKLNMTDEDIVRRFHAIIGVGSVVEVKPRITHYKKQWQWHCQTRESVLLVVELLWPWLGKRRQKQATDILNAMDDYREGLTGRYQLKEEVW